MGLSQGRVRVAKRYSTVQKVGFRVWDGFRFSLVFLLLKPFGLGGSHILIVWLLP